MTDIKRLDYKKFPNLAALQGGNYDVNPPALRLELNQLAADYDAIAALSAPPIEPVGMRECHLGPDHIEHDITCGGPLSHPAMRECLESAIELISEAGPLHWAFHPYEKVAESAQAWEKKAAALLQQAHAALAAKEAVVDTALRENAELVKDKQVLMTGISVAQQAIKELYAHRDTLHAELAVATANADAYRLSMDEAHAEAMRDKAELARVREALEAHEAWAEAEHGSLGTFHQRMELCNYAEWLTEKVLAELRGEPFNKTFEGVPRLLIEPGTLVVNRIVIDEEQAKKLAQAALAAAPVPVVGVREALVAENAAWRSAVKEFLYWRLHYQSPEEVELEGDQFEKAVAVLNGLLQQPHAGQALLDALASKDAELATVRNTYAKDAGNKNKRIADLQGELARLVEGLRGALTFNYSFHEIALPDNIVYHANGKIVVTLNSKDWEYQQSDLGVAKYIISKAQAALAACEQPVVDEVVTVDGVYCFKDVMAPVLEKTKAGDSVRVVVYKL